MPCLQPELVQLLAAWTTGTLSTSAGRCHWALSPERRTGPLLAPHLPARLHVKEKQVPDNLGKVS